MRPKWGVRIVLLTQALLLGGLAAAGLLMATTAPAGVGEVAGFELNVPHSLLLLATAGASVLATLRARLALGWTLVQAATYTLMFLIGTAQSAGRPQDTWLALNTPDHFLHLGLAVLGGVLTTVVLVWPPTPAEAQRDQAEHRRPTPREEESRWTREMIAAEVAVAEGHATADQERRVQEDAQRHAEARRRRAWRQAGG